MGNGQISTITAKRDRGTRNQPLLLVCKFCKFSTREDRGVKKKLKGVKENFKEIKAHGVTSCC